MSKTRVSNLAEKLGIETKELLSRLRELGYDVKSGASTIDDEAVERLSADRIEDDAGPEGVRVSSTVVRRRRTAPVEPEKTEPVVAPLPAKPAPEQSTATLAASPPEKTADKTTVKIVKPAIAAKVQPEKTAEPVALDTVRDTQTVAEKPATEHVAARPEKTEKVVQPAQPERASANQARILGRVEIPIPAEPRPARREQPARFSKERTGRNQGADQQRNQRPESAAPVRKVEARDSVVVGQPAISEVPAVAEERRKSAPHGRKNVPPKDTGDTVKASRGKGKGREQHKKTNIMDREERLFDPVHRSRRKGQKERVEQGKTELTVPKAIKRIIRISETITIGELAKRIGIKATDLIKAMMKMGSMVTINHVLDYDAAVILAADYGYEVENVAVDLDVILESSPDSPESLQKRPPVVTIMGHVDHGKTSLLDAIRKANVISGEAGGITQHIGAYDVELRGRKITFLDTPGHEAFTAMRARGAKVTDIVILVVAADDGVMPQTKEAINHAKAAGVPILVAINKIDKPTAKPERVRQELTEHGLVAEEWGGDTTMVEVSAKQGLNLEELLEMVLLQADVMDLQANPDKEAKGTIVEGKLDKGRGPVATILVQEGTLRVGDYCVVGVHSGRVRAMQNDRGERVPEAGPSMPVEVIGLSGVPDAGDIFVALKDEKQAKEIATLRQIKQRELELAKHSKMSLDELYKQIQSGEVKDLNVIIKADVQGSAEALSESLRKQSTEAVRLNVIHTAVGAITESDVNLASASNAIIIGFSIRPEVKAQSLAEKEGVDIRLYNVIYDAVDDVRKAMEGLLAPVFKEKYLGRAEVRELFSVPKVGVVAGCYVQDGKFVRNAQVRLLRDNVVIYEGKLDSLRRFKDDVKEVSSGYECGMGIENYNDIKLNDQIEAFEMEKVAAKL